MWFSRAGKCGLAAVAVLVLAGCVHTEPGTPSMGSTSSSDPAPSGADGSSGGAPAVPEELDPEPVLSDPCDLLSADQLDELELVEGRDMPDPEQNRCAWEEPDSTALQRVVVEPMENLVDGLNDVYSQQDEAEYFETVTVADHPGVFVAPFDPDDIGDCPLYVAITDELVVSVLAQMPSIAEEEPCSVAEDVAESVIATLRG